MDETGIDIHALLGVLRRRLRMIGLTVLAVLGLALLVLLALPPVYTATTLILVDPSRKNLLETELTGSAAGADSARVDSEVEILRSNAVLLSVVRDRNLIEDREFGVSLGMIDRLMTMVRPDAVSLPSGEEALQKVLTRFGNAVHVQRRGLTYILAASVRSRSPHDAAELANALADAYIAEQLYSKIGAITASQSIIAARLEQTGRNLIDTEQAFDAFIAANIEGLSGGGDLAGIQALSGQLAELSARRQAVETLSQSVDAALAREDWAGLVAALQSDAVAALERERLALNARLTEAGATSAAAFDLRAQLQSIEQRINQQANLEVQELRGALSSLQSQAGTLRQHLRAGVMASDLPMEVLTQLYELQQSAELIRAQYQTLLARNSELQVQADLQVADSRVVAPALAPASPSSPNRSLILAFAGLWGLGLGVGLAFLYENYLGGFTSETQVRSVLKLPVLAQIPALKEGAPPQAHSVADVMISAPLSIYAEAIRRVRSGVDQALRRRGLGGAGREGVVIMVSSSVPGEGKSTLSLALARAYALSGKSTILVDADMRKPAIHRQLGFEQSVGLVDILMAETQSPEHALRRDEKSGSNLILGARAADIPTDQLILGDAFTRMIQACRQGFEVIVIDTPPLGPVVDATHIAQFADAIVFVIQWSSTSQTEARRAVARLTEAADHGPPVLAVLNRQDGFDSRYDDRRYAGYYSEV